MGNRNENTQFEKFKFKEFVYLDAVTMNQYDMKKLKK